jgi:hypothetical protein
MEMENLTPLLLLAALGAYHGINPGMGWLFAVSLGLQERSRAAVLRALGPIALGHAASVVAIALLLVTAGTIISTNLVRAIGGAALVAFGLYKFFAPFSHPRWVGMRVTARELSAWSFLMSTAHGAGLMLIPLLARSGSSATVAAHTSNAGHTPATPHPALSSHASHLAASGNSTYWMDDLLRIGIHTAVMFAVMGLIALIVYERVGLAVLRKAWFNLDRIWACALMAVGVLTVTI